MQSWLSSIFRVSLFNASGKIFAFKTNIENLLLEKLLTRSILVLLTSLLELRLYLYVFFILGNIIVVPCTRGYMHLYKVLF